MNVGSLEDGDEGSDDVAVAEDGAEEDEAGVELLGGVDDDLGVTEPDCAEGVDDEVESLIVGEVWITSGSFDFDKNNSEDMHHETEEGEKGRNWQNFEVVVDVLFSHDRLVRIPPH